MLYESTRGACLASATEAIVLGLAKDGGLFVPDHCPTFTQDRFESLIGMPYPARAAAVLSPWLSAFTAQELQSMCEDAYKSFDTPAVAPIVPLDEATYLLELFHGPTLAFKDMALQLLPRLLAASAKNIGETREILILVATSGDTGKAALAGFADVPGVRICVFYPDGGVSEAQRLQMVTQTGKNVRVVAVNGNFDDAQTGVKQIFASKAYKEALNARGIALSSANSINLGRLVPQIAYYCSAYADLRARGVIAPGDQINVCVPTGNFGNILAARYAKEMGLPIAKLICASNENHVLTDFIRTGTYDRNRAFHLTTSPSMDIVISSNLERLLFELTGRDSERVRAMMDALKAKGRYALTEAELNKLQALLYGGYASETEVAQTIRRTFEAHRYLADPHTAVALRVLDQYRKMTGDQTPTVVAATASPYKFGRAVLEALTGNAEGDDFACCARLAEITGGRVPDAIAELPQKPVLHTNRCEIDGLWAALAPITKPRV